MVRYYTVMPRLFIAIPVSDEVRQAAGSVIDRLAGTGADYKWVDPSNLHVTLSFIGAATAEETAKAEAAVRQAAHHAAFDVVFDGLGGFPSVENPHVLWLGLQEGLEKLEELAAGLPSRESERTFSPHLTLGRLRTRRGLPRLKRAIKDAPPSLLRQRVDKLVLYESRLSSKGPTYTPLLEAPLGS